MFHHIKSKQKTRFSKGHTNLDLDLDKKTTRSLVHILTTCLILPQKQMHFQDTFSELLVDDEFCSVLTV